MFLPILSLGQVLVFSQYYKTRALQSFHLGDLEIVVFRLITTTRPFPLPLSVLNVSNREGNLDNTFPNPYLRKRADSTAAVSSADGKEGGEELADEDYLPAYMLSDWSLERAGRGERKKDSLACELR